MVDNQRIDLKLQCEQLHSYLPAKEHDRGVTPNNEIVHCALQSKNWALQLWIKSLSKLQMDEVSPLHRLLKSHLPRVLMFLSRNLSLNTIPTCTVHVMVGEIQRRELSASCPRSSRVKRFLNDCIEQKFQNFVCSQCHFEFVSVLYSMQHFIFTFVVVFVLLRVKSVFLFVSIESQSSTPKSNCPCSTCRSVSPPRFTVPNCCVVLIGLQFLHFNSPKICSCLLNNMSSVFFPSFP